jgi:hypothetical protein
VSLVPKGNPGENAVGYTVPVSRLLARQTAWILLTLVVSMLCVGAVAGDFCADGDAGGCLEPCHLSCVDGCANAPFVSEISLDPPKPFDEVRWCAVLSDRTPVGPPDAQPPRPSTA